MTRESMSGADLAWLRMERATNPMMVVAVLIVGSRLQRDALRALLQERLLRFERFRQLPVHDALGTHWQTAADFDLDAHLQRLRLPPRAGQAQLEAAAGRLASKRLDPRRPLWQIHLVERYRHGSAIVARFHHCYADGIALMRVLLSLTDSAPISPRIDAGAQRGAASARVHSNTLAYLEPFTGLFGSAVATLRDVGEDAAGVVGASLSLLAHPERAAALAQQVAAASSELANITLLPPDPPTPLKRRLSGHKQLAWAQALPLLEIRTVAEALGCTINDVLLATAAGALGAHLQQRGIATHGMALRALVPVNLRPASDEPRLGNEFGLVFAGLPVGEHNPVARLYAVHYEMERLKHSSQALVALWLLTALGMLPGVIEDRAIELFTTKASVVISNVPGPRAPLYLAGARIEEQFFWVPQAGNIGVGISLLTYDGRVHFGVVADHNLVPRPRELARRFPQEFEKLLLHVVAGSLAAEPAPTRRTSA
jgi:diacylglycerol O-acyltransferase / wax synthase